jgi:DNA-directed RNA polymerase I and III subunit RPAC2
MATAMEIGSEVDPSSATFSLTDEDHTLGNSLRYILNKDPRVSFCGYSVPHPSEARVNIRVQTTGAPARDVLKDALHDLMAIGEHVRATFERALEQHKVTRSMNEMSTRSGLTSQHTSGSVRDQ